MVTDSMQYQSVRKSMDLYGRALEIIPGGDIP